MTNFVIGDLHGQFDRYQRLLLEAGLVDDDNRWTGGADRLILVGDLFDRGIHGIRCLDLTMSLQKQAAAAGGEVLTLLGNHDLMILCAWRFGDDETRAGMRIFDQWLTWGGVESDLATMNETHASWIAGLPAMAKLDDTLLMHADAMLYVDFGTSVEEVNQRFASLMAGEELPLWERTLGAFAEHRAFSALGITGQQRAEQVLRLYGADRLVHGHTPIPIATGMPAESVTAAHEYAGGRCLNVDAGLYLGSPGFVHPL